MKSSNFIFEVDDEDLDTEFDDADADEVDQEPTDNIKDSGYILKTGSKLYYPGENHRVAIVELTTTDLRTDGEEFKEWLARGIQNEDEPLVVQLNSPDGKKYAQVATLYKAVFDSTTRKLSKSSEVERIYVIYTNARGFVWNTNPNEAPQNRLPTRYEYVELGGEGTGGKYWQPFLDKVQSSKKRDALKPSDFRSIIARIEATNQQVSNQILKSKGINFFTLRQVIEKNRSNSKFSTYPRFKRQYLSELLANFIDHPDQKPYPLILVNYGDYSQPGEAATDEYKSSAYKDAMKSDLLSKTGLERIQSLTTDFMEIVHPLALVNNNLTGNANKKILEFLGASSYDELKRGASIQFHAAGEGARTNTPLIDSTVYYQGRKVEISSKKAGGMGASLKNLADKFEEVLNSDAAMDFNRLLSTDPRYSQASGFLGNIIRAGRGEQYKVAFNFVSPGDLEVANRVKESLRSSPATEHLSQQMLSGIGFSDKIATIYEQNKLKTIPKKFNQWQLLMTAIWTSVTNELNSNPAFGNLVTWIFNHAAVIQVDTHTQEIKTKSGRAEVLTNIIGTWPSQTVETVKLSPTMAGENVKYSLLINGYKDQSFSAGDEDTSPLSDKDKDANTAPDRPTGRDTYTSAEDWTSPDEATFTAKNTRGEETALPMNMWAWAGSEYSSQEMVDYGVPESLIQSIITNRRYLMDLVELGPLTVPTAPATQQPLLENNGQQVILTPRLVELLNKGQLDALIKYKRTGKQDEKTQSAFRVILTGRPSDTDSEIRLDNKLRAQGYQRLLALKKNNPQSYMNVYRDIATTADYSRQSVSSSTIGKERNGQRAAEIATEVKTLKDQYSKIPDSNKKRADKEQIKFRIDGLSAEWRLIQISNKVLDGARVTNDLVSQVNGLLPTIKRINPGFSVDERLQPNYGLTEGFNRGPSKILLGILDR
jgi:hypothetical protein